MITYRKYTEEKVNEGTIRERIRTTLDARLRFKKETGPVYKEEVRKRICNKETIPGYLMEVERISYNKDLGIYEDINPDKKRIITIKERRCKLGLDIKVISFMNLKQEDMLNLDGLNELIQENSLK